MPRFDEFLPVEELLPLAQAMSRVFARLGEKKNRNRARLKFLVNNLGIEEFRRIVLEEKKAMPVDPALAGSLDNTDSEKPLKKAESLNGQPKPEGFEAWAKTNVYKQRQADYSVVTVTLPLGDFTPKQSRAIADLARKYVGDSVRFTVHQNLVLRWVSDSDLPAIYEKLKSYGLGERCAVSRCQPLGLSSTATSSFGDRLASRGTLRATRSLRTIR